MIYFTFWQVHLQKCWGSLSGSRYICSDLCGYIYVIYVSTCVHVLHMLYVCIYTWTHAHSWLLICTEDQKKYLSFVLFFKINRSWLICISTKCFCIHEFDSSDLRVRQPTIFIYILWMKLYFYHIKISLSLNYLEADPGFVSSDLSCPWLLGGDPHPQSCDHFMWSFMWSFHWVSILITRR